MRTQRQPPTLCLHGPLVRLAQLVLLAAFATSFSQARVTAASARPAFDGLARAGTNVQSKWYGDPANGADHNLRGFEDRAARDIVEWLASAKGGTRAARRR